MAKYRINTPDGSKYEITAPDNATQEEVLEYAKANHKMTPAYDRSAKGREDRIAMFTDPMKEGVKAALPSEDYNQPITPTAPVNDMKGAAMAGLEAAGQTLRDPTRLGPTSSIPAQVAGEKVEQFGKDINAPITGKIGGFMTSVGLDPATYAGVGETAGKGIAKGVSRFSEWLNEGLGKISSSKLGAKVPERAAEIAVGSKFKLPAGTPQEIELGVERIQKVLNDTKDAAGKVLNEAKSNIGIPTTLADKEKSLMMYGNTRGFGDDVINAETRELLNAKTPEELAKGIAKFKALQKGGVSDKALNGRVADALQNKINGMVDWTKSGDEIQGILKQQYKDLGDLVLDASVDLKSAKGEMAKALDVFDDLKTQLADPDKSGKAEAYLRRLFTSKSAATKDTLESLAKLEHMSGKPVLSDLFKLFAGESYSTLTPNGTTLLDTGIRTLLGQSPAAIKMLGNVNREAAAMTEKVMKSKLANRALNVGLVSLKDNPDLQSVRDRLKNKK